jgi:hypothetical protein
VQFVQPIEGAVLTVSSRVESRWLSQFCDRDRPQLVGMSPLPSWPKPLDPQQ